MCVCVWGGGERGENLKEGLSLPPEAVSGRPQLSLDEPSNLEDGCTIISAHFPGRRQVFTDGNAVKSRSIEWCTRCDASLNLACFPSFVDEPRELNDLQGDGVNISAHCPGHSFHGREF